MKLLDNTIFITGGASGIGRGLAEAFHRRGNKVVIGGRRKALLDEVVAANPGMEALELDVADSASIAAAAQTLISRYPTLNVLINNAGIMPPEEAGDTIDDAAASALVATNLLGPIRLTAALIAHLKRQPYATVIHNTSVLGFVPLATSALYCATKAALHSYAMSQRFMLRESPVRVMEIVPPWVDTGLIDKRGDPRAMSLDAFIAEIMEKLAGDGEEAVVDAARHFRANPGPGEYALVNGFNSAMLASPNPS